jgi:hypothetical protein
MRPLMVPHPVINPIAGNGLLFHAEIGAPMRHKHIKFFKTALVEQQFNTFPRRKLALGVLNINAPLTTAQTGHIAPLFQFFLNIFHHGPLYSHF